MRVVAVDLEMNQPSRNIIQIGAVCFQPDKGTIVDTFNYLVNPGEILNPEIVALTRISDEALVGMPTIKEAAESFSLFKNKHQVNSIGIVWGAGSSNDVSKIYEESKINNPFDRRIIDVKGIYQMLANASTADMRAKIGLKKACENVGINWDSTYGEPHDALADAYNTMRIYMFLSKCLKGGFDIKRS